MVATVGKEMGSARDVLMVLLFSWSDFSLARGLSSDSLGAENGAMLNRMTVLFKNDCKRSIDMTKCVVA